MKKPRRLLLLFLFLASGSLAATYFCNKAIVHASQGRLYNSIETIPYRKTALLLGTSKYLPDGRRNLYYTARIEAAAALYHAGKICYIVASGDNHTKSYNEPETMRADLIAAGVDSSRIFLDYAGFRTFDSIVRLREIFSQNQVTVISQRFHNERALYIAGQESIDAIGFNATDVSGAARLRMKVRERLARVKVFVDNLTDKQPHFLGPKIVIPQD